MGIAEKPQLPDDLMDWNEATREWYDAWRESPHTDTWDARHWQYMLDTAIVHQMIYGQMDFGYLSELRTREMQMGLTFEPPKQEAKVEVKVTAFDKIAERYAKGASRKPKSEAAGSA